MKRQKYDKEFILSQIEIDPITGCWNWIGGKDSNGYGCVNKDASGFGLIHRLAYSLWKGHPGSLLVCHTCDNPPCCNPGHLFAGTRLDNINDATAKGRVPKGEGHWKAKLTVEDVKLIRTSNKLYRDIAKQFGVTRGTIKIIRTYRSWKHVKVDATTGREL